MALATRGTSALFVHGSPSFPGAPASLGAKKRAFALARFAPRCKPDGGSEMRDALPQELLTTLSEPRRAFLRKLILGAAFVVPSVTSFSMTGLGLEEAIAQTGNQTLSLFERDELKLQSDERVLQSDERVLESDERELDPHLPSPEPQSLPPEPYQGLPPEINSARTSLEHK
jgi:hypothetical protein